MGHDCAGGDPVARMRLRRRGVWLSARKGWGGGGGNGAAFVFRAGGLASGRRTRTPNESTLHARSVQPRSHRLQTTKANELRVLSSSRMPAVAPIDDDQGVEASPVTKLSRKERRKLRLEAKRAARAKALSEWSTPLVSCWHCGESWHSLVSPKIHHSLSGAC